MEWNKIRYIVVLFVFQGEKSMVKNNQDLRVQKTKRALATSLLTLLKVNPFNKITVNDVCTEALVSRSAFYANFKDKYDLLSFCLEIFKKNLLEESEEMPFTDHLRNVLNKIQKDIIVFKNLMMINLDMSLAEIIRNSFLEDLERKLKVCPETLPLPGPVDIIAVYYSSAITNTIMYWVSKNMPYTTDEMANFLTALLPEQITCSGK